MANSGHGTVSSFSVDPGTGLFAGTASSTATLPTASSQPTWLAMDPAGQVLLATDLYNNQLDSMLVAAGALTNAGSVATGINPLWVGIDATSTYAYTADAGGGVSIFSLSLGSGAVTAAGQATPTPASGPDALAIDSVNGFVYTVSYGGQSATSYSIGASGSLTQSATTASVGYYPQAVAIDPSGRFLYVGNYDGTISSFQATSGALSGKVSTSSSQNPVNALAFDPTGKWLYGANNGIVAGDVSQWKIDATGALTTLGANVPCGAGAWAIVVNQSGGSVYVSNSYDDTVTVLQASLATGALTTTTNGTVQLATGSAPEGLAVSR